MTTFVSFCSYYVSAYSKWLCMIRNKKINYLGPFCFTMEIDKSALFGRYWSKAKKGHILHPLLLHTGSFRKNDKSKTLFMDTKFHEKLIFSAFFSRELATNLRSWATRSVTITLRHPENVALPVCFQALVGCLKPTTDLRPEAKTTKACFGLWEVLWLY